MTLTTKGLVAALLSGLGVFAGLALDTPFLLATGLLLGSLLVVGALSLRAPEVRLSRKVETDTAHEGDVVPVVVRIEAARRHGKSLLEIREALPGEVELADGNNYALLDLKGGEVAELRYRIKCPVKGYHALGPVRVRVEDPFGFFHRDTEAGATSTVKVYPRIEDLKSAAAKSKYPFVTTGPFLVGSPGTGASFFALREYVRGDTMRDINWKASARSKDLMVNQRERESETEATILLDCRESSVVGTVGENTFLYSCRGAVSLAELFMDSRSRVSLVMYGEKATRVDRRLSQNLRADLLEQVTAAAPRGQMSLGQVVDDILPRLKGRTPVYILSSLVGDPGIEHAVATLRSTGAFVVVLSPSAGDFARLALGAEPAKGSEAALEIQLLEAEREHMLSAVRGMGALAMDWKPGATLGMSLATGVI